MTIPNPLRGEFEAPIGGEVLRFDTMLGTIAAIETRCGEASIVEIITRAVAGRRAADAMALIAAALAAAGRSAEEASGLARRATLGEAEGFLLALMGALGFELVRAKEATAGDPPLAGPRDGAAGAPSRSAP